MVGGPNADKHEIDYEFSEYKRDGLIYEFADATDEDILSVGAADYIEKREQKKTRLSDGEKLLGVEDPKKEDKDLEISNKRIITAPNKPDFTIINASDVQNEKFAIHGLNSKTFILFHLASMMEVMVKVALLK